MPCSASGSTARPAWRPEPSPGWTPESDGHLIDESEAWDVADSIEPGSAAAIALIEHVWAVPLRTAIANAGGVAVSDEWVHPLDLVEIGLLASHEV